ncbi:MAG: aminomethyl transferase family protein, partial [Gammaproteobacteria bacterium]|nr:aminomethyl transferase family protein [Gammaproteobacteria bacterium]
ALWDHLMAAGADSDILGCGQSSMNIRRIEGGILNYRSDMDWDTTPYDMGLGMFVNLEGHDFIGRDALRNASKEPRFCGFKCEGRQIKFGSRVFLNGQSVGHVTAYEISPYLECGVGFVLLDSPEFMGTSGVSITDRDGVDCPVELVDLPFYDAEKNIPRGLEPVDGKIE